MCPSLTPIYKCMNEEGQTPGLNLPFCCVLRFKFLISVEILQTQTERTSNFGQSNASPFCAWQ